MSEIRDTIFSYELTPDPEIGILEQDEEKGYVFIGASHEVDWLIIELAVEELRNQAKET